MPGLSCHNIKKPGGLLQRLSLINASPLSLSLYFCSLLFGLSGTVISMKPSVRSGSAFA
jgi:hypothetical protein